MTARTTRTNRFWRTIFILFAVALTVATHWPRLQLPPETPASDKTIHIVAFTLATTLLWHTRWITNLWMIGVVGMLWAGADEATQALPGIYRHASFHDFIANALGVVISLVGILILQTMHSRTSRST